MLNQINKKDYYKKLATVSVNEMVMSNTAKCCNCNKNLQEFSIFIGDEQRLSTLYTSCCSKCLPLEIKKAIKIGREDAENAIKSAEDRLYKESLKVVREAKLNKLEEIK